MSGGEEMKVKTGHLVMWVQGLVLVLLCAKLGAGAILEKEGETGTAGEEAVQLTNAAKNGDAKADFDQNRGLVQEKKRVALTFDDGPSSKYTPLLLEGLKERGVHATFFLMGKNIEGEEDIVKRMSEEGHLIGNHSYEHIQLTKAGAKAVCEAVEHTQEADAGRRTSDREPYLQPCGAVQNLQGGSPNRNRSHQSGNLRYHRRISHVASSALRGVAEESGLLCEHVSGSLGH